MEQHRNAKTGDPRDPRVNPPTSSTVWHDSHLRKSGCDSAGNRTRFAWVGGDQRGFAVAQSGEWKEVCVCVCERSRPPRLNPAASIFMTARRRRQCGRADNPGAPAGRGSAPVTHPWSQSLGVLPRPLPYPALIYRSPPHPTSSRDINYGSPREVLNTTPPCRAAKGWRRRAGEDRGGARCQGDARWGQKQAGDGSPVGRAGSYCVSGLTPYAYKGRRSCEETCIAAKRSWAAWAMYPWARPDYTSKAIAVRQPRAPTAETSWSRADERRRLPFGLPSSAGLTDPIQSLTVESQVYRMSHQLCDKLREDVHCKISVRICLTTNARKPLLMAGNPCEDGAGLRAHKVNTDPVPICWMQKASHNSCGQTLSRERIPLLCYSPNQIGACIQARDIATNYREGNSNSPVLPTQLFMLADAVNYSSKAVQVNTKLVWSVGKSEASEMLTPGAATIRKIAECRVRVVIRVPDRAGRIELVMDARRWRALSTQLSLLAPREPVVARLMVHGVVRSTPPAILDMLSSPTFAFSARASDVTHEEAATMSCGGAGAETRCATTRNESRVCSLRHALAYRELNAKFVVVFLAREFLLEIERITRSPSGIESGSPQWETSSLTTVPPRFPNLYSLVKLEGYARRSLASAEGGGGRGKASPTSTNQYPDAHFELPCVDEQQATAPPSAARIAEEGVVKRSFPAAAPPDGTVNNPRMRRRVECHAGQSSHLTAGMKERGKWEIPKKNPPTSGIVQHDSAKVREWPHWFA
ncbi:hypothetical protein PR048_017098 [Dryococelus australis]|uniref:Uncharacterized protein n=1 Tax=Dryococelus australis TaxID=614101 RepID=A0ABQ9H965_9NEOP|nr:hypothetical protein PR048_017098 [Dryococelus australis]